MNHHVAHVDQYPFASVFTFDAENRAAVFLDLIAYRGGQRFGLAIGGTGSNRDTVEQTGQVDRVVDANVLGFDVFECIDDETL